MKKYALSGLVIIAFVVYALHSQTESNAAINNVVVQQTQTQPQPTVGPQMMQNQTMMRTGYKDGSYTGSVADAFYGNVQVKAVISGGKITDVVFLDHPQDRRTSQMINDQAMPMLTQEAITAQSANVDIVSGATQTSNAFRESLQSALSKAS